jgi:hypothetical protein
VALAQRKGAVTAEIRELEWPERLEALYTKMDTREETDLHGFIREVTFGSLYNDNERVLQLLFENSAHIQRLPRLEELRGHLQLWIAKANAAKGRKEVALVYVGTKDNRPFPDGIEGEIDTIVSQLQAEIASQEPRGLS